MTELARVRAKHPLLSGSSIFANRGTAFSLALPAGVTGTYTDDASLLKIDLIVLSSTDINPNPPVIPTTSESSKLTLNWPPNAGWILQSQTNSLGVGLSSNWVDISRSSAVTSVTNAVNRANGSVFYGLRRP